ncbi:2561_t:CDS:2, partial [Racocetra fulgida]
MAIESHWRVLKHDFFSNYNYARLDLIIYIIITKVIPRQIDRLQLLRDERCITKWREDFRAEWKKLSTEIIKNNPNRITNLSFWITRQESYPLLKIKDKSSFLDLSKNVYLAVETLTPEICKLIICNKKSNYQKTLECLTQEVSEYQTQEASEYQTQEASEYQNQETSEYQLKKHWNIKLKKYQN